jgi:hypothetical protein
MNDFRFLVNFPSQHLNVNGRYVRFANNIQTFNKDNHVSIKEFPSFALNGIVKTSQLGLAVVELQSF